MKNKIFYGLPSKVKYCVRCNISNQQPTSTNEYKHDQDTTQITIDFDVDNVCAACKSNDVKWDGTINWDDREKELKELSLKFKNLNQQYNCLVAGSGGKDSVFQSHILKYKYGFRPLTVTWAPHIYTNIGWQNFNNWISKGGFDNFLFNPNGKLHRYLTRSAVKNILHPFQPFIIGQKNFPAKVAAMYNIPVIFYGEMPSDYGAKISNDKKFSNDSKESHPGFSQDPLEGLSKDEIKIGGESIGNHVSNTDYTIEDFECYLPLDKNIFFEKKIETHWLGYYLRWVPQENFTTLLKMLIFK